MSVVTVVNLCASMHCGQHLFFFVRVLDGDTYFFFAAGRVLLLQPYPFGGVKTRNY